MNDMQLRLLAVAQTLGLLANGIDEEEEKHPSYFGGFLRAAQKLVMCVFESRRGK